MTEIRFGTDGWRGVIADDFTFENVRAVTQAVADYLVRTNVAARGVVVGYDTRFLSGSFAAAVAEVLAANDVHVALTSTYLPTPVLSHAAIRRQAGAAVMITASHNPARWNGFKLRLANAAAAPPEVTTAIEQAIPGIVTGDRVLHMPLGEAETRGLVERFDPAPAYINTVRDLVDIEAIRDAGLNVLVDSMYGAGAGWTASVLAEGATRVHELHGDRNPAFPGVRAPEPIALNLSELTGKLEQNGYAIGLATDGDGDRFGLVDEGGRFITQLQTFALLTRYLLEVRGERGPIVRSITTTRMIDRLGERYDCPVHETRVGFKYLGERMMATNAIISGEESGGFGFGAHIPDRDGILSGLYMLDYLAKTQRPISQLLADLYDEVGRHEYDRVDVTLRGDERKEIEERVSTATPKSIAGIAVESRDTLDGFRFTLEGGWWLLLRFSGTEPLLRIYAEMPSMEEVQQALLDGQEIAGCTL